MTLAEQFKKAQLASVPLTAIQTTDAGSTIATLAHVTNGAPVLVWDRIRGVAAFNDQAAQMLGVAFGEVDPATLINPTAALIAAINLPAHSILFFLNGHIPLAEEHDAMQAVWNLRDMFKQDHRMLCILAPVIKLRPELANDFVVFDEPLPDTAQLAATVIGTYKAASVTVPKEPMIVKAVDAICGLPAFIAEQVCAMSISDKGLDLPALWERKRKSIETTNGLMVYRGREKAADVKGADNVMEFLKLIMVGASLVVFIDEIEKMFAGMGNEQDSTTKEMVGEFLTWCERKDDKGKLLMMGVMLLGPAGTGKSLIAKAIGNESERPTIMANFAGMKDSLVGQSNQNMTQALKVIDAVAGDKPRLVIATCNSVTVLPPEVRRRFNFGTYFCDLPDAEARRDLWKQYTREFNLSSTYTTPPDEGWTGAEIRNCCMIAEKMGRPLKEAAERITPISVSASEQIADLRRSASRRFLSAAKPGLYTAPVAGPAPDAFAQRSRSIGKH